MDSVKTILVLGLIVSLLLNVLLVSKLMSEKDRASNTSDIKGIDGAFSGLVNDPKTLLLQAINDSESHLDIAIYNLEDEDVVQAIIEAHNLGVEVRVITDSKKAKKEKRALILDQLVQQGIKVKVNTKRKMHLKMAIMDEITIVTGSYNYTKASANDNLEQLMVIDDESLAREWTEIFGELWNGDELSSWEESEI